MAATAALLALASTSAPRTGHAAEPEPLFDEGRQAPVYLLMRRDQGFSHADQLDGIRICGRPDNGLVFNQPITEHFVRNGTRYTTAMFEKPGEQLTAFEAGRCDAVAIYNYYDIARAERDFDPEAYVAFPIEP